MDSLEFGKFIKQLRKDKEMTLVELSSASNVSQPYLSHIENGKRGIPSPDILKKLADPLGYSYAGLMYKAGYIPVFDFLSDDEEIEKTVSDAEKMWERKKKYSDFRESDEDLNELSILLTFPDLTYKNQPLTDPDRKRILIMLEQLFPDRK